MMIVSPLCLQKLKPAGGQDDNTLARKVSFIDSDAMIGAGESNTCIFKVNQMRNVRARPDAQAGALSCLNAVSAS
jgi:hypothetical protein